MGLLLIICASKTHDSEIATIMGALVGGCATAIMIDTFEKRNKTQISNENWRIND